MDMELIKENKVGKKNRDQIENVPAGSIENNQGKAFNKTMEYIAKMSGRLVNSNLLTEEERKKVSLKKARFEENRKGEYIVIVKLKQEYISNMKKANTCRIVRQVTKDQLNPVKMINSSFAAMDLYFHDILKVNKCLNMKDSDESYVLHTIENRTIRSKDILTGWTDSLLRKHLIIRMKCIVLKDKKKILDKNKKIYG